MIYSRKIERNTVKDLNKIIIVFIVHAHKK